MEREARISIGNKGTSKRQLLEIPNISFEFWNTPHHILLPLPFPCPEIDLLPFCYL